MSKKKGQKKRSAALIEALEPRLLFSADMFGGAVDSPVADDPLATLLDDTVAALEKQSAQLQQEQTDSALSEPLPEDENLTSPLTEETARLELVFVDTDTPDYQQLVDDMLSDSDDSRRIEVIILDNDRDGIDQITETLQSYQGVDAIHLISHGADGSVDLGGTQLNSENLSDYQAQLQSWSQYLDADADILFYGCNLAASEDGEAFIEQLAGLTGADVAASDDLTGSADLGGDWELEYRAGEVETNVAFSAQVQQQWSATLATETIRDEFNVQAYSNNDGTALWTNDWQEIGAGETDGATGGDVRVTTHAGLSGNVLRIDTDVLGEGASRTADLSSASTATLSFDYMRIAGGSGTIDLEVYDGTSWNLVNTFSLPVTDVTAQQYSVDISAYADANTQIRFVVSTVDSNGKLAIDNVQIEYTITAVSFQQGTNGYTGTEDTSLRGAAPDTSYGTDNQVQIDLDDTGSPEQGLIRFDNIFGTGANQIQYGSTINSVSLTIEITNQAGSSSAAVTLHRMLTSWDESSTWNSMTGGLQTNDVEVSSSVDATILNPDVLGSNMITGLASTVQAWSDGAANYGWAIFSDDTNGLDFSSSEEATIALRPQLTIDYTPHTSNPPVVVDTTADNSDAPDLTSISALFNDRGSDGKISLREAITATNNTANGTTPDEIHFNISTGDAGYVDPDAIPGNGDEYWSITVNASGLPYLLDPVILDATTQPGYSGNPVIELDGSATPAASGINGIRIHTNDSTVKGFIVHSFADEGIEIDGSTGFGDNNIIQNNWVGIDASGTINSNAEYNVMISVDATGNKIGGTGANDGNVIGGSLSGFSGLIIQNNSDNNIVEGNYIGLMPDGVTAAGNGGDGILIRTSSDGNRIGGTTAGAGNVISGNTGDGINIDGTTDATYTTAVTGTIIQGNHIGTDVSGTLDRGNLSDGIQITYAVNNIIGGTTAAERNVIAGNTSLGINIRYAGTTGNIIQGNYVGVDATGTSALGNGLDGVKLQNGASGNTIGGTAAGAGNVIGGNRHGIYVQHAGTDDNLIQGNFIGTDATGTVDLGNTGHGILLTSDPSNNTIGGTVAGAGNTIAFNTGRGIWSNSGTGNSFLQNTIYANGNIGIDVGSGGVTANDSNDGDTGANNLQNFPVLTQADLSGSNLTLSGSLDTDGLNTQYRIEFFGNVAGTQDPTNGEARYYLGSTNVTTDGSGDATFSSVTLSGVTLSGGDFVTATATKIDDPAQVGVDDQLAYGDTSEFAVNFAMTTINDVSFTISSTPSVSEDLAETATFTVTLGGNALTGSDTASVDITASGSALSGTDYDNFISAIAAAAGSTAGVTFDGVDTLTFDSTFNGGSGQGAFAFTVDAIDDTAVEGTETIVATLSSPSVINGSATLGTFSDSFAEANNTSITAHTPDSGLSWTEYFNDSTYGEVFIDAALDVIQGGSGASQNNTGQAYTAGPDPIGVDQTISFTLSAIETDSGTKPVGIFGRSADVNNFYYLRILPNGNAQDSVSLWKMVGGAPTQLGSIDVTIAAGDTFKLEITDGTKKAYHNGTEVLSSTDNALTAAGTWGFFIGDFNGVGGHYRENWNIDNFLAEDSSSVVTASTDITETDVNNDPTVDNAIANQAATEDVAFNFTFAANVFGDIDAVDTLTYTAQLAGGGALPSWLNFDAATRTFSGTPLNADVGTVAIDVIADDGNGGTPATDTFSITVANVNDAPSFFTGDGIVTTAIGTGDDLGFSSVVQADGKILVAGYSYNGSDYDVALVRYNADGTLDTSFSGDGMLTTAIGSGDDTGYSVTLQPDGKILVAGHSYIGSNSDFALVRYNTDGTLDTSFSGDGLLTTPVGLSTDKGYSVTVQADGKILVAGHSYIGSNYDFALVRYNADGTLDTSFSGDGLVTTSIGAGDDTGYSATRIWPSANSVTL